MILSVSRRTDIPAFFSEWFFNRIKDGYLYVRNPMNIHQVSEIPIKSDVVDCIVFWTKNPTPMMKRIDELNEYMYYFQYTINGYGNDVEPNLPDKERVLIPAFQELSKKVGRKRVIWRYDPIFFSNTYTMEYHIKTFEKYAKMLNGYTDKCVISFIDIYAKNKKNMEALGVEESDNEKLMSFATKLADIARMNGMKMASCAEMIDLDSCGIEHNHCIDKELIESLIGYELNASKDKVQRVECGCEESIEVGTYNTCLHGCKYCYANYCPEMVKANYALYDPASPLLCSEPMNSKDKKTDRKVKSLKGNQIGGPTQMSLFDLI